MGYVCLLLLLSLSSLGLASNFVINIITCDDQVWRSFGDSVDETFNKSWSALVAGAPLIMTFNDLFHD